MAEEAMLTWISDVLKPYLVEHGGGPNGSVAILFMDPAKAHLLASVRAALLRINCHVAIMPASTTYLFQMIDVVVGKMFKVTLKLAK